MTNFNNNSFKEIAAEFEKADSILLFPHMLPDGDAIGSCGALCHMLRKMGKTAYILIEDPVPKYLAFLEKDMCTFDMNIIDEPDICACIDCGEVERFAKRKAAFEKGKIKICIDHHATSKPFTDFSHISPEAAATGELIFKLLKEFPAEPDEYVGEALFAAITTDTGNFQYSNTTKQTHLITAELYDLGFDHNKVSVELYENIGVARMLINGRALDNMEIFAGGKAAVAYVTQKMLDEAGAEMDDTEGIIQSLRSISGVEIAVLLKELSDGRIKAGMRAKTTANVAEICSRFGGGGHVKAAGCSLDGTLEEAKALIMKEVEASL